MLFILHFVFATALAFSSVGVYSLPLREGSKSVQLLEKLERRSTNNDRANAGGKRERRGTTLDMTHTREYEQLIADGLLYYGEVKAAGRLPPGATKEQVEKALEYRRNREARRKKKEEKKALASQVPASHHETPTASTSGHHTEDPPPASASSARRGGKGKAPERPAVPAAESVPSAPAAQATINQNSGLHLLVQATDQQPQHPAGLSSHGASPVHHEAPTASQSEGGKSNAPKPQLPHPDGPGSGLLSMSRLVKVANREAQIGDSTHPRPLENPQPQPPHANNTLEDLANVAHDLPRGN